MREESVICGGSQSFFGRSLREQERKMVLLDFRPVRLYPLYVYLRSTSFHRKCFVMFTVLQYSKNTLKL